MKEIIKDIRKVAVVYDCDLTLTPGYMQEYLFLERFDFEASELFKYTQKIIDEHKGNGLDINSDTAYLHAMVVLSQTGGPLEGLDREVLNLAGRDIKYFPGIPDFFKQMSAYVNQRGEGKVELEQYVVSTGLREMLRGSILENEMTGIAAGEFFYNNKGGLVGVAKAVTHAEKTAEIIKISKGAYVREGVNADTVMQRNQLHVPIEDMIYIGDGPSDVPAMSVVSGAGGSTIAVYGTKAEQMRLNAQFLLDNGYAQDAFEADYRRGSKLHNSVLANLEKMVKSALSKEVQPWILEANSGPKHLF
ncbi:haloacid dehalogenase-like hydrolase [archaeon]|jgi:hypothetical protein|nr:haloacid dehalogenase-like hydrolase [archaeon]MBT6697507.1 haloacid dehalogenase-like hydrolase [archaeon]